MKKVTLIFSFILMFISCDNTSTINKNEAEELVNQPSQELQELIEYADQYRLNIDTTKTYNINIKVYQTLEENDCLAHECSNERYNWYNGQLVYYVTSDMIYDEKIIKEKAYLLGTYKYKTVDTIRPYRVVPFYCEINEYESLKKEGFFDFILEMQEY